MIGGRCWNLVLRRLEYRQIHKVALNIQSSTKSGRGLSHILKMTETDLKWSAPVVRDTFLKFFEEKGHTIGEWRGR